MQKFGRSLAGLVLGSLACHASAQGLTEEQFDEAMERLGEVATREFDSLGIPNGSTRYEVLDQLIAILEKVPVEDANGNGQVDLAEFTVHAKQFVLRLTGDVTGDGLVDEDDLVLVMDELGQTSSDTLPKGDTDGDGDVDADDVGAVVEMAGVEIPLSDAVALELVSRLIYRAVSWGILPREGDDGQGGWNQLTVPGPNDHAAYFSSTWPSGHSSGNSNFWPPNHEGSISPTWLNPPNHNQLQSEIWPANHYVQPSETWPPLPSDEHYENTSRFWPSNHQGYRSTEWPDGHLSATSRSWPPNHSAPASIGTGPPTHDVNISSEWDDWSHSLDASLEIWPHNHYASISASWPPAHDTDVSDTFPPNHFAAISTAWPDGGGPWPPNHLSGHSGIWDTDPTRPIWWPDGHTIATTASDFVSISPEGAQ